MTATNKCDGDGPCGFHLEYSNKTNEPCGAGYETRNERIKRAMKYHKDEFNRLNQLWKQAYKDNTLNEFG